jgi:hypothetical protein
VSATRSAASRRHDENDVAPWFPPSPQLRLLPGRLVRARARLSLAPPTETRARQRWPPVPQELLLLVRRRMQLLFDLGDDGGIVDGVLLLFPTGGYWLRRNGLPASGSDSDHP